jgi:Fe2+ or Zn2+ uptake regulation protein
MGLSHPIPTSSDARRHSSQGENPTCAFGLGDDHRTLNVLKEMGLVEEHRLGEIARTWIARTAPHYHFTCLKCGQMLEFDSSQLTQIARQLNKREGLRIASAHLFLNGYCAKCRQAEPSESE